MKRLCCACLLPMLTVSAWGQAVPQGKPSVSPVQADAMVDSLYRKVVTRQPLATPDWKIFGRYLSKKLRHGIDANDGCGREWHRLNPDPNLKPPDALLDFGIFSGDEEESEPQAFHIEKADIEKDGSYRVDVKLTREFPSFKLIWHVVAIVVQENGRPVVDEVLYLKGDRDVELRLSELLVLGCKGAR